MHYKNGRKAKNGDKVVMVSNGKVIAGILHDAQPGNDYCNGNLAPINGGNTSYANLKECVHLDDFLASNPLDVPNMYAPTPSLVEQALTSGELARIDGDKFQVPPGHPAFKAE